MSVWREGRKQNNDFSESSPVTKGYIGLMAMSRLILKDVKDDIDQTRLKQAWQQDTTRYEQDQLSQRILKRIWQAGMEMRKKEKELRMARRAD